MAVNTRTVLAPFWQDGNRDGRLRRDELRGDSLRTELEKQINRRSVYTESPTHPAKAVGFPILASDNSQT
jgi:hypothetical protein